MTTLVKHSKVKIAEQHVHIPTYFQKNIHNLIFYWTSIGANLNKSHFLDYKSFKHKRTEV